MKTNELEKEIGLSKYTIRYYEKEGLIQPKREENGYRDYDDETVQKLKIIKFLRNLQISVDDIKAILDGELDFRHCLKINQVNMQKQIESMNEIKDTIDDYYDKDLPLIEELSEIKNQVSDAVFAFYIVANVIGIYKGDGWQAIIEENTKLLPYISHAMYEIGLDKIEDATKNIEQILEIIENV